MAFSKAEKSRLWYIKNKDRKLKKNKEYYYTHLKQQKLHREVNKEKLKQNSKEWYQNNKSRQAKRMKEWYKINRDKVRKQHKDYYQNNKEQIEKQRNKRLKTDIKFRIRKNLKTRLYQILKGNSKSVSILKIIGCSIEFLKNHLETNFTNGMSFSNYGKWHVDHIKPCASFDLSKPKEQRKCFHYTNLQPLWAIDNLQKGSKEVI